MARLYREAPLNSIWEGTANMMCMDVRRAMMKDPRTTEALFDEVRPLSGQDDRFDAMVQHTELMVREALKDEFHARPMTEALARLLQGAELMRHSTPEVVDVFLKTRSPRAAGAWGSHYGTMALTVTQTAAAEIVRRASLT
jgi:putative acyl-CoA dehydrogenase